MARHPHGWQLLALARQAQTSESRAFALKAAGACRALRLRPIVPIQPRVDPSWLFHIKTNMETHSYNTRNQYSCW